MYRKVLMIAVIFCLMLAGIASAAEQIGFVNSREVLFTSIAGKKASEEIEKLQSKLELQVKGSEAELQKLGEELKKQESVLTPVALQGKRAEWQEKINKHQFLRKGAEEELRAKQAELVNPMEKELLRIINSIAEKEKYTAIFDTAAGVLYKNKSHDLTKRVLEEFDKTYKAKK